MTIAPVKNQKLKEWESVKRIQCRFHSIVARESIFQKYTLKTKLAKKIKSIASLYIYCGIP